MTGQNDLTWLIDFDATVLSITTLHNENWHNCIQNNSIQDYDARRKSKNVSI
jgi:hypothetical protein